MNHVVLKAALERMLQQSFGEVIEPDHEGDYPLPGRGDFYARLATDGRQQHARVQIFAVAVRDVPVSADLLLALNVMNSNIAFARAFWVQEQVLFETEIVAQSMDQPSLSAACSSVGWLAADVGPKLAADFGGTSKFTELAPEDVPTQGPPGYL